MESLVKELISKKKWEDLKRAIVMGGSRCSTKCASCKSSR
jgi:hypothetical protein